MRWNAKIGTGDTPRVEELAQKHDLTVEAVVDEGEGVASVTVVEGSHGAAKKLFDELGATDIVEEPPTQ